MKTQFSINIVRTAIIGSMLITGITLRAITTATPQTLDGTAAASSDFTAIAFRDSAEAGMMHRAYHILATGDHDYDGHRIKAMHAVEAAAKLLDLDLSGDAKDHEKQFLSDDKMREAKGLLEKVLGASEVKDQKRITRHLKAAIKEINDALKVR